MLTILMPVYNAGLYLGQAVQSILDQTYPNFTLLIINDGSTDNSGQLIRNFSDERIIYKEHSKNIGLIETLNEGIALCTSKYLVRMDADDVSLPDRLEKQLAYMEANPGIAICGSWFSLIDSGRIIQHPLTNAQCRIDLFQNTVMGHPTVIMRMDAVRNSNLLFDKTALYAEDYKFWADAAVKGLQLANMPDVLLHYRVHAEQVSSAMVNEQSKTVQQIKNWYADHFFGDIISGKRDVFSAMVNRSISSFVAFTEAKNLAALLKAQNRQFGYFDFSLFDDFIEELITEAAKRIFILCVDCGAGILWKSLFEQYFYTSTNMLQKIKFSFKSLQNAFS